MSSNDLIPGFEYAQLPFTAHSLMVELSSGSKRDLGNSLAFHVNFKLCSEVTYMIELLLNDCKPVVLTQYIRRALGYEPTPPENQDPNLAHFFDPSNRITILPNRDRFVCPPSVIHQNLETQLDPPVNGPCSYNLPGLKIFGAHMQILLSFALETKNIPLIVYLCQPPPPELGIGRLDSIHEVFSIFQNNSIEIITDQNGDSELRRLTLKQLLKEHEWQIDMSIAQEFCDIGISEQQRIWDTSLLFCAGFTHIHLFKLLLRSPNHLKIINNACLSVPAIRWGTDRVATIFPVRQPFLLGKTMSSLLYILSTYNYMLLKFLIDQGMVREIDIYKAINEIRPKYDYPECFLGPESLCFYHINAIIRQCALFDDIFALKFMLPYYIRAYTGPNLIDGDSDNDKFIQDKIKKGQIENTMIDCDNPSEHVTGDDAFQFLSKVDFESETVLELVKWKSTKILKFLTKRNILRFRSFFDNTYLTTLITRYNHNLSIVLERQTKKCTEFVTFLLSFPLLKQKLSQEFKLSEAGFGDENRLYQNYLDYCIQLQIPHITGLVNDNSMTVRYESLTQQNEILNNLPSLAQNSNRIEALCQTLPYLAQSTVFSHQPLSLNHSIATISSGEAHERSILRLMGFNIDVFVQLPLWISIIFAIRDHVVDRPQFIQRVCYIIETFGSPEIVQKCGKINLKTQFIFIFPPNSTAYDNVQRMVLLTNNATILHMLSAVTDCYSPVIEALIELCVTSLFDTTIDEIDQFLSTNMIDVKVEKKPFQESWCAVPEEKSIIKRLS